MSIENEYNQRINNAKARKIEFSLSKLTFQNLRKSKRCFYLNIPLNVFNKRFKTLTKFTIDRKNPFKGYIKGNCCASSHVANQLKSLVEFGLITTNDIRSCANKIDETLINI